jgi:exodeoxyribonuclease VII large subunit
MSMETLSVSEVLALAKRAIDVGTGPVWVVGEVSGFKRHQPSGHLYFDMKDGRGRISCVQWRDSARKLRFDPLDGMLVRAHGRLGVYESQGRLQLYVDALEPAGIGELQAALEALKARLAAEGLFDPSRKRPLPPYPRRIGLATSNSGAAVRDVIRVLGERWPVAEVILRPCAVQGEEAREQIVAALRELDSEPGLDLIILARGGGSIEDLWCFNEEDVVRAVAGSRTPIVTGVGHEIDVTMVDFASDLRAATPSQAAELAVPSRADLLRRIGTDSSRLAHHASARVRTARLHLSRLEGSYGLRLPVEIVRQRTQRIDDLAIRLDRAWAEGLGVRRRLVREMEVRWGSHDPASIVRRARERLVDLDGRIAVGVERRMGVVAERLRRVGSHLRAVGPETILARGYAICLRPEDGRAVRSFREVEIGGPVRVLLGEGELGCVVEGRKEDWE